MGETYKFHVAGTSVTEHTVAEDDEPISPDKPCETDSMKGIHWLEKADDEEEEDKRKMHQIKDPGQPTQAEVDEHELTHCPYKPWCSHCVRGKAAEDPHRRKKEAEKEKDKEEGIPTVSLDYCFMGSKGLIKAEEGEIGRGKEGDGVDAKDNPIVVIHDSKSGTAFAHAVKKKGRYESIVKTIVRNLDSLGYNKITMKRDQESSIEELCSAVKQYWNGEAIPERSPTGESQSNGRVERCIRSIGGQIRTLKDALEFKIKTIIPATHPIMAWIVQWAAFTHNKCQVGRDGATPYERLKKKKFTRPIVQFGEKVLYKEIRESANKKEKLDVMWLRGVWIGVDDHAEEALIGTEEGVVRAHSVKRLPAQDRWRKEAVLAVKGTPEEPVPGRGVIPVPVVIRAEVESEVPQSSPKVAEVEVPRVRSGMIYRQDYEEHGYTANCPGCTHMRLRMDKRPHTPECRQRMEEILKTQEKSSSSTRFSGRERMQRGQDRVTERIANKMEEMQSKPMDENMDVEEQSGDKDERSNECNAEKEENAGAGSLPMDTRKSNTKRRMTAIEEGEEDNLEGKRVRFDPSQDASMSTEGELAQPIPRGADMEINSLFAQEVIGLNAKELNHLLCNTMSGADVSEIYSPERVVRAAKMMGLKGGISMDITTHDPRGRPWDFDVPEMRNQAVRHLIEVKPLLLIGSPMCTMFSQLQALNWGRSMEKDSLMYAQWRKAVRHMEFVSKLYKLQIQGGRYFLHEHPRTASSWTLRCMRDIIQERGVYRVEADMCRFGLTAVDALGEGLVKKPTSFLTNSLCIADSIGLRCNNSWGRCLHRHVHLTDGRARNAGKYTHALCRRICEGLIKQKELDSSGLMHIGDIEPMTTEEMKNRGWSDEGHETDVGYEEYAEDDVSGAQLDPEEVKRARKLEIEYIKKMRVYTKVPRSKCEGMNIKPITTRWIDVNKGDDCNRNYRSRMVAREIKRDNRMDLFAATPPLEALKLLISEAATVRPQKRLKKIMVNDISRAYFYAPARRSVFIEVPEEDKDPGDGDVVGELRMSLYGTRDAAQNWQECYTKHLEDLGFVSGKSNPCIFWNEARGIQTLVHGDDYVSTGDGSQLEWMKKELEKRFEVKSKIIGPECGDEKELKVLNRIIRCEETGYTYEPDQRHAEILIEGMGVKESRGVKTPGIKDEREEQEEDETELPREESGMYRALAARANYLAADRADIQFAVKEICRSMSKPTRQCWAKLKRLAKYLAGKPRVVQHFEWQEDAKMICTYSDSDWAGCRTSRKSTSGGAIMIGKHCVRTWSKTQATIALSSAEAELTALVKATCESIGISSLLKDIGKTVKIRVYADANAALGIVARKGSGRLRHLDTSILWVQQKELQRAVEFLKVHGVANPADLMTKHLQAAPVEEYMKWLQLRPEKGRAKSAANLR